jgi:hypothetical protein
VQARLLRLFLSKKQYHNVVGVLQSTLHVGLGIQL